MMKRVHLLSITCGTFLMLSVMAAWPVSQAQATDTLRAKIESDKKLSKEEAFIQNLGDNAIEILANKKISEEEQSRRFRKLMHKSFDLKTIARFVLGRTSWNKATKQQKDEYLDLFEQLVVKTYSDRFSLYTGEGFKVHNSKPEGSKDFVVNSAITRAGEAPSTTVSWRVRNRKDRLGIIDVMVEGVSMSVTQRQEYASVIQRNGGDINALLSVMRERLEQKKETAIAKE